MSLAMGRKEKVMDDTFNLDEDFASMLREIAEQREVDIYTALLQLIEEEFADIKAKSPNLASRPIADEDIEIPEFLTDEESREAYRVADRELRPKLYQMAREYWGEVGDAERLALTDEELDKQFWLFDNDGIPRLKSDQGKVELLPNPLLQMAEAAHKHGYRSGKRDLSERSREILRTEYPRHLKARMDQDATE
jgi:hypothetical protein